MQDKTENIVRRDFRKMVPKEFFSAKKKSASTKKIRLFFLSTEVRKKRSWTANADADAVTVVDDFRRKIHRPIQ